MNTPSTDHEQPCHPLGRTPPKPLRWFDTPRCHDRSPLDIETLNGIIARHMAGHGLRPTGTTIRDALLASTPTRQQQTMLWNLFEQISGGVLATLMAWGGITVYELARAMHRCHATHPETVAWINQWADEPDRQPPVRMSAVPISDPRLFTVTNTAASPGTDAK